MSAQPETEEEMLRRTTKALFVELSEKGLIDGTYEEWLKDATEKATKKLAGDRIITPTQ